MAFYDFRNVVYKTNDFGSTFTTLGSPVTFTGTIELAAISSNNNQIIIIAKDDNIEKSTNGGATFFDIKNNLPTQSISDISFDPINDDIIFVTYGSYNNNSQKIYQSINGGSTWTNISYNLGNMPVNTIVLDHTPQRNLYVGTEIGIYTKPFNDNTWTLFNTALPNNSIQELEINYGSNTIKAASWGRGLWENHLVGRQNHPAIVYTTITDKPTLSKPLENIDQFVTSKIHFVGNLTSVFLKYGVNTINLTNTIPFYNLSDSIWRSINPLPNGPSSSNIYFRVYAVGANNDTTETYRFMYTIRPFLYCSASGTTGSIPFIVNVSINPGNVLNNPSSTTTNDLYSLNNNPVLLNQNGTYTLSITNNNTSSGNDDAAWIDYNYDSEFTSNEQVLYDPNTGQNSSASFTIPSSAVTNTPLRMRVRSTGTSANLQACGSYSGEVEDYIVVRDCNLVSNLNDSGYGSLREAVSCATAGDTILFAPITVNQKITITSSPIIIDKNLTIIGSNQGMITVSSVIPQVSTLQNTFQINGGINVKFENFKIVGAYGLEGSAILNNGSLTINNMTISSGGKNDVTSIIKNQNGGTLEVKNNNTVSNN